MVYPASMPDVAIRRAGPADRSLILHFHRALYVTHRQELVSPGVHELSAYRDLDAALRDDVDALLRNPAATVLVAERASVPVGYITGHVETDPRRVLTRRGVVEDWFVEPGERRGGAGRALFEALVEVFRGAGCEVVESMTWAANDGARAAHRALGFDEIDVRYRMRLPE